MTVILQHADALYCSRRDSYLSPSQSQDPSPPEDSPRLLPLPLSFHGCSLPCTCDRWDHSRQHRHHRRRAVERLLGDRRSLCRGDSRLPDRIPLALRHQVAADGEEEEALRAMAGILPQKSDISQEDSQKRRVRGHDSRHTKRTLAAEHPWRHLDGHAHDDQRNAGDVDARRLAFCRRDTRREPGHHQDDCWFWRTPVYAEPCVVGNGSMSLPLFMLKVFAWGVQQK